MNRTNQILLLILAAAGFFGAHWVWQSILGSIAALLVLAAIEATNVIFVKLAGRIDAAEKIAAETSVLAGKAAKDMLALEKRLIRAENTLQAEFARND